jgi:hypothetical protein
MWDGRDMKGKEEMGNFWTGSEFDKMVLHSGSSDIRKCMNIGKSTCTESCLNENSVVIF